jgi:hypothetical protein
MIYTFPESEAPIRQSDIFKSIPLLFFDPEQVYRTNPTPEKLLPPANWLELTTSESVNAVVGIQAVYGIVITQDCDTEHGSYITLALVDLCESVLRKKPPQQKSQEKVLEWWMNRIITDSRNDQGWFYLPPDEQLGFKDRMAANFDVAIPVPNSFLSKYKKQLRLGRLNDEADEHFREQLSQYYRRYPYDEWYPLNKAEFELYKKQPSREGTPSRPYQS